MWSGGGLVSDPKEKEKIINEINEERFEIIRNIFKKNRFNFGFDLLTIQDLKTIDDEIKSLEKDNIYDFVEEFSNKNLSSQMIKNLITDFKQEKFTEEIAKLNIEKEFKKQLKFAVDKKKLPQSSTSSTKPNLPKM